MKIRTFFYILLGFFGLGVVGYGLYRNSELLSQPFHLQGTRYVPVLAIIVAAFVGGFFLALFFGMLRDGKFLYDRYRKWREEKRLIGVEERYYEGVQAVVEGREEDALRNFQIMLGQDPNHFNALLKAGEVLVGMGK